MNYGCERVAKRTCRDIRKVQADRKPGGPTIYATPATIEANRRQAANLKQMAAEAEANGQGRLAGDLLSSAAVHLAAANRMERLIGGTRP